MNKLHIAAGTVYLKNYCNVDIVGDLAADRPDIVDINQTTYENYYKKDVTPKDFMNRIFHEKPVVVDMKCDVTKMPFPVQSFDEILAVQILEHFTFEEGKEVMKHWVSLLKPGGTIQINVPDLPGIMEEWSLNIEEDANEWAIRQIYGSQKNEYNLHKAGYSITSLSKLMMESGTKLPEMLDNIHNYPSICLKAEKR